MIHFPLYILSLNFQIYINIHNFHYQIKFVNMQHNRNQSQRIISADESLNHFVFPPELQKDQSVDQQKKAQMNREELTLNEDEIGNKMKDAKLHVGSIEKIKVKPTKDTPNNQNKGQTKKEVKKPATSQEGKTKNKKNQDGKNNQKIEKSNQNLKYLQESSKRLDQKRLKFESKHQGHEKKKEERDIQSEKCLSQRQDKFFDKKESNKQEQAPRKQEENQNQQQIDEEQQLDVKYYQNKINELQKIINKQCGQIAQLNEILKNQNKKLQSKQIESIIMAKDKNISQKKKLQIQCLEKIKMINYQNNFIQIIDDSRDKASINDKLYLKKVLQRQKLLREHHDELTPQKRQRIQEFVNQKVEKVRQRLENQCKDKKKQLLKKQQYQQIKQKEIKNIQIKDPPRKIIEAQRGIIELNLHHQPGDYADISELSCILGFILDYPCTDEAISHHRANILGNFDLIDPQEYHNILKGLVKKSSQPDYLEIQHKKQMEDIFEENKDFSALPNAFGDLGKQPKPARCRCCGLPEQNSRISILHNLDYVGQVGLSINLFFRCMIGLTILLLITSCIFSSFSMGTNIKSYYLLKERQVQSTQQFSSYLNQTSLNDTSIQQTHENFTKLGISIDPNQFIQNYFKGQILNNQYLNKIGNLVMTQLQRASFGSKYFLQDDFAKKTFYIQCYLGAASLFIWFLALFVIKYQEKKYEILIDRLTTTSADFTLMFSGVPKAYGASKNPKQDFQKIINSYLAGYQIEYVQICKVNFAYFYDKYEYMDPKNNFGDQSLQSIRKQIQQLRQKFVQMIQHRQTSKTFQLSNRQERNKMYYDRWNFLQDIFKSRYKQISRKVLRELFYKIKIQKKFQTMTAFVTFQHSNHKKFIQELHKGQGCFMNCIPWFRSRNKYLRFHNQQQFTQIRVQEAPQPEDVIWASFNKTKLQIIARKIITYLALFVTLGFNFFSIYKMTEIQIKQTQAIAQGASIIQNDTKISLYISIYLNFMNTWLKVIIRFMSDFQCHKTYTAQQSSIGIKSIFAQIANSIVIPLGVALIFKKPMYGQNGLADTVFYQALTNSILFPIQKVLNLYYALISIKKKRDSRPLDKLNFTQKELTQKFEDFQFQIGYEYVNIIFMFLFACLYATLQPVVVPITAVGIFLSYWSEKIFLFYYSRRPKPGTSQINQDMYVFIYFAPLVFTGGSFLWSLDISLTQNIVPNYIALGFSILILLMPYQMIVTWIVNLNIQTQNLPKFTEERLFVPSQYDRFNPFTSKQAKKEYNKYQITKIIQFVTKLSTRNQIQKKHKQYQKELRIMRSKFNAFNQLTDAFNSFRKNIEKKKNLLSFFQQNKDNIQQHFPFKKEDLKRISAEQLQKIKKQNIKFFQNNQYFDFLFKKLKQVYQLEWYSNKKELNQIIKKQNQIFKENHQNQMTSFYLNRFKQKSLLQQEINKHNKLNKQKMSLSQVFNDEKKKEKLIKKILQKQQEQQKKENNQGKQQKKQQFQKKKNNQGKQQKKQQFQKKKRHKYSIYQKIFYNFIRQKNILKGSSFNQFQEKKQLAQKLKNQQEQIKRTKVKLQRNATFIGCVNENSDFLQDEINQQKEQQYWDVYLDCNYLQSQSKQFVQFLQLLDVNQLDKVWLEIGDFNSRRLITLKVQPTPKKYLNNILYDFSKLKAHIPKTDLEINSIIKNTIDASLITNAQNIISEIKTKYNPHQKYVGQNQTRMNFAKQSKNYLKKIKQSYKQQKLQQQNKYIFNQMQKFQKQYQQQKKKNKPKLQRKNSS